MELDQILSELAISRAEWAVLFHVRDTVVIEREALADFVGRNLPNNVPQDITVGECLAAIDALVRKRLLVELTEEDLVADRARWRAETIPVSWGVDRRRAVGDVDLTDAGFQIEETIMARVSPVTRQPRSGYNDEDSGVIRVFGETEAACLRQLTHFTARADRGAMTIEPVRAIGAWWYSRFERLPLGFEIVIRKSV